MNETAVSPKRIFIFENLTAIAWLSCFLPLLRQRQSKNSYGYYIDSSFWGRIIGRVLEGLTKIHFKRLEFRLTDCHDSDGNLLRWKITYFELPDVLHDICASRAFQNVKEKAELKKEITSFLAKNIATSSLGFFPLWRTLFLVRILDLQTVIDSRKEDKKILFLEHRLWIDQIKKYAENFNIEIYPVRTLRINIKKTLQEFFGPTKSRYLRNLYCGLRRSLPFGTKPIQTGDQSHSPRLGVEYYGQLNLDRLDLYSDVFFMQSSSLCGKDIQLIFDLPKDPLDENKQMEIERHGINPVVLNAKAVKISAPYFNFWPRPSNPKPKLKLSSPEEQWLQREVLNYYEEFDYWQRFFETNNIKVFTSWFKYDARHFIMSDALRRSGGIMTIYQRAWEEFSAPEIATKADVVFTFSRNNENLNNDRHSDILHQIVVGYMGDHRFPLLKKEALRIRALLEERGARHIMAYFDESSLGDPRWYIDHKFMEENYIFLMEKVLSEKWLGLVLKPKSFMSLRQRLGKTAQLLDAAQKTGRCYIFQEGAIHVAHPPAAAALACDIAIHGHLFAATAGMESALAGVPTLLLDREGWNVSKLYRLGYGRVVFTQWAEIWKASLEHWRSSSSIPGFGDWSPLINELDPFRDGQAAKRLGTYFEWLLEGFRQGISRERILSEAAQRYGEKWGYDKIIEKSSVKNRPVLIRR